MSRYSLVMAVALISIAVPISVCISNSSRLRFQGFSPPQPHPARTRMTTRKRVTKNVLHVVKDTQLERRPHDVLVWEWHSPDLGQKLPAEYDFVLSIPESAVVQGLKRPPPPGKKRELTLEMFTEENRLLPNVPIRQEANDGRGRKRQDEKGQRRTP